MGVVLILPNDTFWYFMSKGTVRLLFQPAEEGGAGAFHMIKEGALEGVEAIFGMHVDYQLPTGTISSHPGPTQAAVCFFEARIEGIGGSASTPHFNVDPVVATSFAILAMQQLISREDDPLHSLVYYLFHWISISASLHYWNLSMFSFSLDLYLCLVTFLELPCSIAAAYHITSDRFNFF